MHRKATYIRSLGILAVIIVASAGLAVAQNVQTDYDHHANFSQYHTYSWSKVEMPNPLFNQRVKDDVNKELQSKGWQMVPSGGQVDLVAMGTTQNKTRLNTFYNGFGFGGWGWGGFPDQTTTTQQDYKVGTLVLDMFDASNHKLLWRGTASDTISHDVKDNQKHLENATDKFFKNFPPKAGSSD